MRFIERITDFFDDVVEQIDEWVMQMTEKFYKWSERFARNVYTFSIETLSFSYESNSVDEELAHKCQEYIDENFPYGLEWVIRDKTFEERISFIQTTFQEIASIMEVDVEQFEIRPFNQEWRSVFGFYNREKNCIWLNDTFLRDLSVPEYTEHLLLTIFHELKHARQYAAVLDQVDYGYSEELLSEWALNMKYYISFQESDEAYRKQPLELDAFGWVDTLKVHAETI